MKPMYLPESLLYSGIPAIMLLLTTQVFIPLLSSVTLLPLIISWYICALFLVFLPMFIASLVLLRRENRDSRADGLFIRFRLNNLNPRIFLLSLAGTIIVFMLTYLFLEAAPLVLQGYSAQPGFMQIKPLKADEMWILAAWIPMFIFNILGEAFYWRGYIFPRQELAFKGHTWMVHGSLWMLFHISFGLNLLLTLLPIIFITSYLVQKTRSTWTDIIIHALVNGTGFILVAFGVVS